MLTHPWSCKLSARTGRLVYKAPGRLLTYLLGFCGGLKLPPQPAKLRVLERWIESHDRSLTDK